MEESLINHMELSLRIDPTSLVRRHHLLDHNKHWDSKHQYWHLAHPTAAAVAAARHKAVQDNRVVDTAGKGSPVEGIAEQFQLEEVVVAEGQIHLLQEWASLAPAAACQLEVEAMAPHHLAAVEVAKVIYSRQFQAHLNLEAWMKLW
jgi:hypothetical protein